MITEASSRRRSRIGISRWLPLVCLALLCWIPEAVEAGSLAKEELETITEVSLHITVPHPSWERVPGFDEAELRNTLSQLGAKSAQRCGVSLNPEADQELRLSTVDAQPVPNQELLAVSIQARLSEPAILERMVTPEAKPQKVNVITWQEHWLFIAERDQISEEILWRMWTLMTTFFSEVEANRNRSAQRPFKEDCLNPPDFQEDLEEAQTSPGHRP